MILKKIIIEGFRSFLHPIEIDFDKYGNLIVIQGHATLSTASGIGKSSILMAILYALDILNIPYEKLKNLNSKTLRVELLFKYDNKEILIKRIDNNFTLFIDNVEQIGKKSFLIDQLYRIFNITPDILKFLIYRPQRSQGYFINLGDLEKKELLGQILNITHIENLYEKYKQIYKNIQSELQSTELLYNNLLEFLQKYNNLEELHNQLLDIQKQLHELNDIQIDSRIQTLKQELHKLKLIQNKVQQLSLQVTSNNNKLIDLSTKIKEINNQIQILQNNICYVCKQTWIQASEEINKLSQLRDNYYQQMQEIEHKISQIQSILSQINLHDIDNKITSTIHQISEIETNYNNKISHKNMLTTQYNNLNKLIMNIHEQKEKINLLNNNIQALKEKSEIYYHLQTIFSREGFIGYIYDEFLIELNNKINEFISKLSNLSHYYVEFISSSFTKNNKENRKISLCIYYKDQEVAYSFLSGGQQAALELCIDLALRDIILKYRNIDIDFYLLDEGMDGLDYQIKQELLSLLQYVISQIIIIDHSLEIKELISDTIVVNYSNGISYLI